MKNDISYSSRTNIVLLIKEDISIRIRNKISNTESIAPNEKWIDILKGTQLLFNSIDSRLTILSTNKTEQSINLSLIEFTESLICYNNATGTGSVNYLLYRVGMEVEDITEIYIRDSKINMIIN